MTCLQTSSSFRDGCRSGGHLEGLPATGSSPMRRRLTWNSQRRGCTHSKRRSCSRGDHLNARRVGETAPQLWFGRGICITTRSARALVYVLGLLGDSPGAQEVSCSLRLYPCRARPATKSRCCWHYKLVPRPSGHHLDNLFNRLAGGPDRATLRRDDGLSNGLESIYDSIEHRPATLVPAALGVADQLDELDQQIPEQLDCHVHGNPNRHIVNPFQFAISLRIHILHRRQLTLPRATQSPVRKLNSRLHLRLEIGRAHV